MPSALSSALVFSLAPSSCPLSRCLPQPFVQVCPPLPLPSPSNAHLRKNARFSCFSTDSSLSLSFPPPHRFLSSPQIFLIYTQIVPRLPAIPTVPTYVQLVPGPPASALPSRLTPLLAALIWVCIHFRYEDNLVGGEEDSREAMSPHSLPHTCMHCCVLAFSRTLVSSPPHLTCAVCICGRR